MYKIGVFDSGIGGLSVANAIKAALPEHEVIFRNDSAHMPYGTKTTAELRALVMPILQEMAHVCDVIVIACNTITTTLIPELRQALPIPLVGMEPMVKPAAEQTKSNIIAVCATPATLASDRYKWLKVTYAPHATVLEPDCSDWAKMVETNQVNKDIVAARINDVIENGADVIVLGCTHYHWIENLILEITAGRAAVIQPEQPVIEQLKRVLATL